jgi:hypothetical protein
MDLQRSETRDHDTRNFGQSLGGDVKIMTAELKQHLQALRVGRCDAGLTTYLEQVSARTTIEQVISAVPIVFQQRTHEQKREIGLAREAACLLKFRRSTPSAFPSITALPTLVHCLLISTYDDTISEITWASRIHVRRADGGLALSFGKGHKLDRTVDGWTIKPLRSRTATRSEDLLNSCGWRFDAFLPFGAPISVSTSA